MGQREGSGELPREVTILKPTALRGPCRVQQRWCDASASSCMDVHADTDLFDDRAGHNDLPESMR